jgi:hypothetical protein
VDFGVQIAEPKLKIWLIVPPRHAVHAGAGFALERIERCPKRIDRDVVQKRGEP